MHLIVMETTLLIIENHEKSWNCIFEFLWELCTFPFLFRDIMFYSTVLNMMSAPTCLKKFLEDAQLMFSLIKYR